MRRRMDGSLVPIKAKLLVDDKVLPFLAHSVDDPNIPWGCRFDAAKKIYDIAFPKEAGIANGGGAQGPFLTIVIPPTGQAPGAFNPLADAIDLPHMVLDFTPQPQAAALDDELPPKPEGFKMPGFELTRDLIGAPLPPHLTQAAAA